LLGTSDPEGLKETLNGLLAAIIADFPWAIIPGCPHDVLVPEADVLPLIQWFIQLLKPDGKIAIACGPDPIIQAVWIKAMKAEKLYVEVITVLIDPQQARAKCFRYIRQPSRTQLSHVWIIGRKHYQGGYNPKKCFGMFVFVFFVCSFRFLHLTCLGGGGWWMILSTYYLVCHVR
jgi:hypothetical protein